MYEDRDEEDLLQICWSADYTEEARAIARQQLIDRGYTNDLIVLAQSRGIGNISPRDERVRKLLISWLSDADASQIIRQYKRRRLLYVVTSTACIATFWITNLLGFLFLIETYNELLALTVFLLVAHLLIHVTFWRRPARILLLRSFNTGAGRYGLRRLFRRHVRFFGHVYTLQDKIFQSPQGCGCLTGVSSWLWGALRLLFTFRTSVTSDAGVWELQHAISQRIKRNLNWAISLNGVFAIDCYEQYWQSAVRVLANACDLIIVDVTELHRGVSWEVAELGYYGLNKRVMFITCSNNLDSAKQAALTLGTDMPCPVFSYDPISGDINDSKVFLSSVADRLCANRSSLSMNLRARS